MQTVTEMALTSSKHGVFTRGQAAHWAQSKGARLDGLLKRAVASDEVWRLHRGLYCLSSRYLRRRIDPLAVAQRIHGPSYISLETALSHHGWIPEGVQAITSVALGRSRSFETALGLFSFVRVPQRLLFAGVRRIAHDPGETYFLASPLKAMADLVYVQRRDWTSVDPLIGSLRVDEALLRDLSSESFDEVASAYKPGRVLRFLAGLREDLDL